MRARLPLFKSSPDRGESKRKPMACLMAAVFCNFSLTLDRFRAAASSRPFPGKCQSVSFMASACSCGGVQSKRSPQQL